MPAIPAMPVFSTFQHKHLCDYAQAAIVRITTTSLKEVAKELSAIATGVIKGLAKAGALPPEEEVQLLQVLHTVTANHLKLLFEQALHDNPNMLDD